MLSCMSARNFVARPESVTVIAWLLIIFSVFDSLACAVTWSMRDLPAIQSLLTAYRVPFAVVLAVSVAGVAVYLLCAVALLLRQGWARHVYIVSALILAGFSAWASPWPLFALTPSLVFPLLATVFLYRPAANRWFEAQETIAAG